MKFSLHAARKPPLSIFKMRENVFFWRPWMSWRWPSATQVSAQTATTSSSTLYQRSLWTLLKSVLSISDFIACRVTVKFYWMAFTFVAVFRLSSQSVPWWCAMAAVSGSSESCRPNWRSTSAWHQLGRPFLSDSFSLMSLAITWTSASTRRSPTQVQARWGFILLI